jgi:hypothetical protein
MSTSSIYDTSIYWELPDSGRGETKGTKDEFYAVWRRLEALSGGRL